MRGLQVEPTPVFAWAAGRDRTYLRGARGGDGWVVSARQGEVHCTACPCSPTPTNKRLLPSERFAVPLGMVLPGTIFLSAFLLVPGPADSGQADSSVVWGRGSGVDHQPGVLSADVPAGECVCPHIDSAQRAAFFDARSCVVAFGQSAAIADRAQRVLATARQCRAHVENLGRAGSYGGPPLSAAVGDKPAAADVAHLWPPGGPPARPSGGPRGQT